MTQNNLYMENEDLKLYVDVNPVFIDELENSKNAAIASAASARTSEENARTWKDNIIAYKTNLELFYAQASDNLTTLFENAIDDLTETKDFLLSNIQELGNNIINSINNTYQSVLLNLQTTGQNIINQAQNIIDNRVSEEYLIQSNAMFSGEVSDINNVYSSVQTYAHSTFCGWQNEDASPSDPKKFLVRKPQTGATITITNDGIASGFSASDYLFLPMQVKDLKDKSWKFRCRFYEDRSSLLISVPLIAISGQYLARGGVAFSKIQGLIFSAKFGDSSSSSQEGTWISIPVSYFSYDGWYESEITFNLLTGTYTLSLFNANGVLIKSEPYTPETQNKQLYPINLLETKKVVFGHGQDWNNSGLFDLKYVSTFEDGVPTFLGNITGEDTYTINNATVTIPYTLSKTGSKIVDAHYRTQVTALYNQQGYAPYYTIDESNGNFTLPMGEIYGMLENIKNMITQNPSS